MSICIILSLLLFVLILLNISNVDIIESKGRTGVRGVVVCRVASLPSISHPAAAVPQIKIE